MYSPVPKTYRVYYNAREEAPFIWSFDQGTILTERKVKGFHIFGNAIAESGFDVKGNNSTTPIGYIRVTANTCTVADDVVFFT